MAQFRGLVSGRRGEASRLGTQTSGLTTTAQSWQGQVTTRMWHNSTTGLDMVSVTLGSHGSTVGRVLYYGPANGWNANPAEITAALAAE